MATPLWQNLTREEADFLRTIAPMAGSTIAAYIDGCDRRMKTSRPGERWYDEAFGEKARWQAMHAKLRTLQNRALQTVIRPTKSAAPSGEGAALTPAVPSSFTLIAAE